MLRVETQQSDGALVCRLQGRLTGEGAEQVRALVARLDAELRLAFDLTEMMFIDAIGEEVLSFVKKLGAQFIAETAYSRDICERLDLPLVRNQKSNTRVSGNSNGKSRSSY